MLCANCGYEISNPNAKFCTKCGTKVERQETVACDEKETRQQGNENILKEENFVDEKPDLEIHKKEDKIIFVDETKEVGEEVQKEEEVIPDKVYSPLEQALNNMQNRQKKCPHCGMLVINEARFCSNCGKKI